MGTQPGQVGDEKFSNWVKDTLALLYTKECLEVIADERSAVFHGKLKTAIGNNSTCTCSWQALNQDRKKQKWVVKNCPGVCQKWLDLIISHHSNHPLPKLAPRNTDPGRWPSDTWEVMKVYQSNGCKGHHSARDADVAALIDLMRNCDHFAPLITNPSLINQVITVRNKLMHSKDFKVENQKLSHDLQSMLSFLRSLTAITGASSLSATEDQAVQTAITEVDKLRTSILDMTLNRELQLKTLKAKQVALETDMKVLEQTIDDARADTAAVKSGLTDVEDKLSTAVQTLQQRLVSQLSMIQDVKKDMTEQQQSAATVVSNLAHLQQQFDDLKLDHVETKNNIIALKQRMSDLEITNQQQASTITTLYQRQQTTETELQHQQQESQAHASQLEHHQNKLDTHTSKLDQLGEHQGEIDTHTIMLQDHETQLQGHRSHIESQHRTLGSHETQLQGHQSHIESQNRTLDSHETQLQGHQSHIESQNRTLDSHETQLQGHQSHIESQNRTLECHEATLDRLEKIQIAQQTDGAMDIKGLQHQLISMYKAWIQHFPVYLLMSERKIRLEDVYVEQHLKVIDPDGRMKTDILIKPRDRSKPEKIEKFISSLKDVFYSEGNKCQYVYVSGNAGYGKSIFCSHLVRLWCNAHSENTIELTPDEEVMAELPLLFCVDLRDAKYDGTNQTPDEMCCLIQKQLQLSGIALPYNYVSKLLQAEGQVLVVMDALDECKEERLPRGGKCNNCTTLVTSRPWKFEALRCDPECRIDKELEIVGLKKESSEDLSVNLVKLLNKKWNKSKDSKDFIRKMREEGLQEFLDIPVMLTSMLCLWFDDIPFGQSQVEVYRNSIHHQILTAVKSKSLADYSCPSEAQFPICQREKCRCQTFGELLWKISELACKSLLGNVRERSLVMDHDQTEILGLTDKEVAICMKLGILTQYKLLGNVTDYEQQKSVSFTHKTYQEWFAAIYLSSKLPMLEINKLLSKTIVDLDSALELDQVFLFVCGLNEEVAAKLSEFIMSRVSSDARIQDYRRSNAIATIHDHLIRTIQDVIELGGVEAKKNNKETTALQLHDVKFIGYSVKGIIEQVLCCGTSHARSVYIGGICGRYITQWFSSSYLEKLYLENIVLGDVFCDTFCAHHLACMYLHNVSLIHDTLESLCASLTSAGSLRTVDIRQLTCITHKDKIQDCSIMLDLSQHQSLEELALRDPGVGEVQAINLSPNMDKLEEVWLRYVTLTHAGLESLYASLATAGRLRTVSITELTCISHRDNRKECYIQLDFSQRKRLKSLSFEKIHQLPSIKITSLPSSSCMETVDLRHVDISPCDTFCDNFIIDMVSTMYMEDVILAHDQLESLCGHLGSATSLRKFGIRQLTCKTHKSNIQECYIHLDFSQYVRLQSLGLEKINQSRWLPNVKITSWTSSPCRETLDLHRVDMSRCDTFCDNIHVGDVFNIYLEDVMLKLLGSATSLRKVGIRQVTCKTHQNNRQECYIQLDFSQFERLQSLGLVFQHQPLETSSISPEEHQSVLHRNTTLSQLIDSCTEQVDLPEIRSQPLESLFANVRITSWPSSSRMKTVDLRCVDLSKCDTFCDNFVIDMVSNIYLENVKLTHDQLESLCGSLASARSLRKVVIRKLTCITHRDNTHNCSIMLDLSRHQGLKKLRLLDLGVGEVQEVRLCQTMEKVELCNITLTHGGLESLCRSLVTAGSLRTVDIHKITCITHKDNIQACYIQLDFSQYIGTKSISFEVIHQYIGTKSISFEVIHQYIGTKSISFEKIHQYGWQLPNVEITSWPSSSSCITTVDLRSVDMLPCDTFCDNFVIDMVSNIYLENVKLTHDQLESLCGSLASARSLRKVVIRKLTCITHQDNRHDCSIWLNLSQHRGLKELRLLDLGVCEVQGVSLCQNMEKVELNNITLTHDGLESLCGSLATAVSLRTVDIRELTCITHQGNRQECGIILNSDQHQGLEDLKLCDLGVGEVQGVSLCRNMNKLRSVELGGFSISAAALRQTLEALPVDCVGVRLGGPGGPVHGVSVLLGGWGSPLRVRGAEEARQLLGEIRRTPLLDDVKYTGDECVVNHFWLF